MKESAEKRKELLLIRRYLIDSIDKIDSEVQEYAHVFSMKEVTDLGWEYDYYYAPGNESMYSKNGKSIRVPVDGSFSYILTYEGKPMRQIMDLKELEDYCK